MCVAFLLSCFHALTHSSLIHSFLCRDVQQCEEAAQRVVSGSEDSGRADPPAAEERRQHPPVDGE
jgi:hypothetical protein